MINITANLLHNIRNGVQIEFILEPRAGEVFSNATNSTENARVDIKGWNVFIRGQLAYFHLNVFNPFARTYGDDSLQKVYEKKTTRKKATLQRACYRLIYIFNKRWNWKRSKYFLFETKEIGEEKEIMKSEAVTFIRGMMSFALLRATNLCIRGYTSYNQSTVNTRELDHL